MYSLHFAGTEEYDPSWLVDNAGRVIVFRMEHVADKVKEVLFSGEEDIQVLAYTDVHETVASAFEERYLKGWRYN